MLPNAGRYWLWLGLLPLACGPGPLPPENPKTQPDTAAPPISIQIDPAPPPSSVPSVEPKAPPPATTIVIKGVGFSTPESVLYLAESDSYLVSNINGSPTGVDNNGFISKLKADGTVENLKFISGGTAGVHLDAPKGMAVVGDMLYVADITELRSFDLKTGAPHGSIRFPRATFLNDVAVGPNGELYVTDSGLKVGASGLEPNGTDAIYKVVGQKVSVFAKGSPLGGPNGIQVEGEQVTSVTFGKNILTRYDANGKVLATAELPGGGLDGVVILPGGKYLVASWQTQSVYFGDIAGGFTVAASDLPSPADIGWSPKDSRIAVPLFMENEVRLVPFSVPAPTTKAPTVAIPTAAIPTASTNGPAAVASAAAPTASPAVSAVAPATSVPAAASTSSRTPAAKP